MQIYRNYDNYYVCFGDRNHSPIKAVKKLYNATIQQDEQVRKFFESPG